MNRPHQQWTITDAPDTTGYLGGPYYKIVLAGTERALVATANAEVKTMPQFTGSDDQLWRIDQLTDGTYRIMPKKIPNSTKNGSCHRQEIVHLPWRNLILKAIIQNGILGCIKNKINDIIVLNVYLIWRNLGKTYYSFFYFHVLQQPKYSLFFCKMLN